MSYHPPTSSYTERSVLPPGTIMHHSPTAAPLIQSPSGSHPLPSFNSPLSHKASPPLPAINPNGPYPPVLEIQHPFSPHSRSSSSGLSIVPSPPPVYPSVAPLSSNNNMRFEVVLEAPTAAAQKVEESPLTYLNKGQFYNITLKDTEAQDIELVSTVHIMFHDESHRKVAPNYWKFWLSQQKNQQAARAIDIDQGRSVGVHNIETRWFDRITFQWNGKGGATVNIRFNCLSTDFSRIKGVKGIPLRLHMETRLQGEQQQMIETSFCRIKLFRDKGAERKNKDDAKHIEKQLEKLRGKNGESHPLWLAYSQTQPYTVFCEVPSSPTNSTSGTPSDLEAVRRMSDGSISTATANNGGQSLSRTSSQHNGMFLPPPPTIVPNFSQHAATKRPYPMYHQYHPLVSPPPLPSGPEMSSALAATVAVSSGNPYFMQPAAIDLDPTYMPQRKRRAAKKSIFVKGIPSNEAYYRAVYLDDLTVENLIQKLMEKLDIKTDQKVKNVIRHVTNKENIAVCVDDSVVQDIPEEQDMEVETTSNDDGSITLVLRY